MSATARHRVVRFMPGKPIASNEACSHSRVAAVTSRYAGNRPGWSRRPRRDSSARNLLLPELDAAPRGRHRPHAAGCSIGAKLVVERGVAAGLGLSQRTIDVDLGGVGPGIGNGVDAHRRADGVRGQGCATLDLIERAGLLDRDQIPWADVILEGLLQTDSVAGQAVHRHRALKLALRGGDVGVTPLRSLEAAGG